MWHVIDNDVSHFIEFWPHRFGAESPLADTFVTRAVFYIKRAAPNGPDSLEDIWWGQVGQPYYSLLWRNYRVGYERETTKLQLACIPLG